MAKNGKMDGKAKKYMAHMAYGAEINFKRGYQHIFWKFKKKFHANLKNQLILAKNSQNGKMDGKAQKYMAHVANRAEINFGRGYQHIFWKF